MIFFHRTISSYTLQITSLKGRALVIRNWFILVTISVGIFIVEIIWSVSFFKSSIIIPVAYPTVISAMSAIDTNAIQHVSTIFSRRASIQATYESGLSKFTDPSQ